MKPLHHVTKLPPPNDQDKKGSQQMYSESLFLMENLLAKIWCQDICRTLIICTFQDAEL